MKRRTRSLIVTIVCCMVFSLLIVAMENVIEARGSTSNSGSTRSSSTKPSNTRPSTSTPNTKNPTNNSGTTKNSARSIIYHHFHSNPNSHLTYQQLQQDYQYSKKNKKSLSEIIKPKEGGGTRQDKQVVFTVIQDGHKYQVSYARGPILLQGSCKFAFRKESEKIKLSFQCQALEIEEVTSRDLQYFYVEVDDQYVFYIPDNIVNYSNEQESEEGIQETNISVTDEIVIP